MSLSNDVRYCLVLLYRPCGLSSHSSFHYFSSLLLLMCTLTCQSAQSIFGSFFFVREDPVQVLQLDQMKVQNRLARLLLVNSYHRTSVILVTAVCHCRHHDVAGKCSSQMCLHKCYQNKSVFIVLLCLPI